MVILQALRFARLERRHQNFLKLADQDRGLFHLAVKADSDNETEALLGRLWHTVPNLSMLSGYIADFGEESEHQDPIMDELFNLWRRADGLFEYEILRKADDFVPSGRTVHEFLRDYLHQRAFLTDDDYEDLLQPGFEDRVTRLANRRMEELGTQLGEITRDNMQRSISEWYWRECYRRLGEDHGIVNLFSPVAMIEIGGSNWVGAFAREGMRHGRAFDVFEQECTAALVDVGIEREYGRAIDQWIGVVYRALHGECIHRESSPEILSLPTNVYHASSLAIERLIEQSQSAPPLRAPSRKRISNSAILWSQLAAWHKITRDDATTEAAETDWLLAKDQLGKLDWKDHTLSRAFKALCGGRKQYETHCAQGTILGFLRKSEDGHSSPDVTA